MKLKQAAWKVLFAIALANVIVRLAECRHRPLVTGSARHVKTAQQVQQQTAVHVLTMVVLVAGNIATARILTISAVKRYLQISGEPCFSSCQTEMKYF
jgi:hypothetical protein